MIVEQIWTGNAYRNFNYLIACPETGEAMAVDPLDHQKCLAVAKTRGWQITQVLNTHEHFDHIGGNDDVIAAIRQQNVQAAVGAIGTSPAGTDQQLQYTLQAKGRLKTPRWEWSTSTLTSKNPMVTSS